MTLPLLAMQFTDEVVWTLSDFVVAAVLLFGAGLAYELVSKRSGHIAYRFAVGLAVATALFLVWANLAVGLIGAEDNPANLLYIGVLLVGLSGAWIARLEPRGMARALLAMALAQMLVPVIALLIWRSRIVSAEEFSGVVHVFGVNAFFAMLFIGSALLFRCAVGA